MITFGLTINCAPWVYAPEVLPLHVRVRAAAVANGVQWIWVSTSNIIQALPWFPTNTCEQNFLVVMITPTLIERISWRSYLIFMAVAVSCPTQVSALKYPKPIMLTGSSSMFLSLSFTSSSRKQVACPLRESTTSLSREALPTLRSWRRLRKEYRVARRTLSLCMPRRPLKSKNMTIKNSETRSGLGFFFYGFFFILLDYGYPNRHMKHGKIYLVWIT